VQDDVGTLKEPYVAKVTSDRILDLYLDQKVDLSYVMRSPRAGAPYVFDWSSFDDEVMMVPAEVVVDDVDELLPGPGYFARNHTETYRSGVASLLVHHAYMIDGNWSAKDFSRFYSKIDDLYSIFSFLDDIKDGYGAINTSLSDKIAKFPWKRGGSYFGFFRDIVADTRDEYPLKVSKILYASPGQIEVRGVKEPLDQIDALLPVMQASSQTLTKVYNDLHGILTRDKVLGSDARDFSNAATARMSNARATILLKGMGITDPERIKSACQGHSVLYAKIALAIFRRGEEFYRFYEEGRMRPT
jgi:hypothetical protein